jgi:hypothetical protein
MRNRRISMCSARRREDHPRLPQGSRQPVAWLDNQTGRREINMLRKTILALAATLTLGAAALPATDASAYCYRGWHHWHRHYGWHRHHGWHRHYAWHHQWGWRRG